VAGIGAGDCGLSSAVGVLRAETKLNIFVAFQTVAL